MDVLMRARWAKRILVLVDRVALRDQALEAFREHIPSEPTWPQTGEKTFSKDRRIYVTTYPTMLNLIEAGTTPESRISPFFFDVVIADESHRSIYNIYKSVMDYFNAIKLGLTATPRDHIDHDTFKIFECDANDPSFAYTYEEAVNHEPPFLCDFEVLKVRSKFQLEGIKGSVLPAPVQKQLVIEGLDVEEIDFEGTDLERKVSNSGTNALILREFMEECIKDESGVLPGKTIIFAISKAHAYRLQELFDSMYPEHAGKLARVLVSEDRYVHGKGGLLDQFKNQDMPRIAISVDMLDTGVDVREIQNLVFAKPVYSYVKFWQMIGRGTRVLEDEMAKRKPWCKEKDRFLIIDCWGNFEHFKMHPKGKEPNSQVPMPVRLFKARLDRLEAAIAKERADIVVIVSQALRKDIDSLPVNNVIVSEQSANLAEVKNDQFWERLSAQDIGFLRSTIAPILRARIGLDVKSIRFETDVVELGTALLAENEAAFEAIRESLLEQVSELPLTVNTVAREKELIEQILRPGWWTSLTEEKMQEMIDRLAPLMRYRQKPREAMVKLDIEDLVAIKESVEFGPEHERMSTSAYRERLEAYVRELAEQNPVLQKIQNSEEVSTSEIHELARLLEEQSLHVTEDILRKVYDHKTARFIQFMRHILGLEKLESWSETVTAAFDAFITEHNTLTELQIRFLKTLQTFMLQTGKVERHHLIDAPFTGIHPQGIRGVFKPDEIKEVISLASKLAA
jgi:type I restriction enzyme R subunit